MDSVAVRAERAVKEHRWSDARQLLDKAINISRAKPDIELLDARATTLAKLERLTLALRDAKTIIQLWPKSPRVSRFR